MGEEGEIDAELKKKKKKQLFTQDHSAEIHNRSVLHRDDLSRRDNVAIYCSRVARQGSGSPVYFLCHFWECPLFHYNIYNIINSICI